MADNITLEDLADFSDTAEDLGVVSSHKNMVVSEILRQVASFLKLNPDATAKDMAHWIGAKQSDMDTLIKHHDGLNWTKDDILFAEEIRPFAPHNRQPAGYPVEFAIVTAVTTIVLALRLYSRIKVMGGIRHYDYIMVFGYFITLGIGLMSLVEVVYEPFTGWYDSTTTQLDVQQAVGLANMILYPLAQIVIKSSLLLFYWQLSDWKPFRWGIIATWVFLILGMLSGMFTYIFSCLPVELWKTENWFEYHCSMDYVMILVVESALTIVTDVAIWLLPIFLLVRKLKLQRKEKIGAVLTFGLGTMACFASGFRLMALKHDYDETGGQTSPSKINIFTSLELNLTIICASAPALRALIVRRAPILLGSSSGSGQNRNNSDQQSALPIVENSKPYGHPIRRFDAFVAKPTTPAADDADYSFSGYRIRTSSVENRAGMVKHEVKRAYNFGPHSNFYDNNRKVVGRDMV